MSKVVKAKYTADATSGFDHRTAMEEAARCLLCHDAPCSQSCPAGTDPGKFIRSIRFRNVKGAAETIRENNPLGASCARVCPYDKLCEEACSRCGIDRPIEIGKLQRYAMEQEKVFGMKTLKAPAKKLPGKVACVGAGPSGLACAAKLAEAGYRVTVFERESKAGGVCTYGIIPSRLPQAVVDQDIRAIRGLGVKFVFNTTVSAEDLNDFDAVFFGIGLWKPMIPDIEGRDLKGVYPATRYLKEARTKKEKFDPGKKVVVIGGGDVAVDCAVTAKLLGAEDVRIVYRRSLEEAPGNIKDFTYALELGIGITTNMVPVAIKGKNKVELIQFKGRKITPKNNMALSSKTVMDLECTTVVFAVGQGVEDFSGMTDAKKNEKGGIKANAKGRTSDKRIFAGGDFVYGGKTVVEAVAAGKSAANSIIEFLQKEVK